MASNTQRLLQRFIHSQGPDGAGEWRAFCPFHEDPETSTTPSASFNFNKRKWFCHVCDTGGSLADLIENLRRMRGQNVKANGATKPVRSKIKQTKIKRPKKPLPTETLVQAWHDRLMKHGAMLEYLTDTRGLTKPTLKHFQIGWDNYRLTLPVRDEKGHLVNIRRYDKNKRGSDKMISWGEGYGQARIYGIEIIKDSSEVVFAEGEWDRILACQEGIPAVCVTAGAGTFNPKWGPLLRGKDVYFCYDNDQAGRRGAMRAAQMVAAQAEGTYVMDLDIDIKGGDITDFFAKQGRSLEEFRGLMAAARSRPFGRKQKRTPPPGKGLKVSLEDSQSVEYGEQPIEMVISISGKQNPPYVVPRTVHAHCSQDKGQVCSACPMATDHSGDFTLEIQGNEPVILDFADIGNRQTRQTLREHIGAKCNDRLKLDVKAHWTVEQLMATNSVEHRDEAEQRPMSRDIMNVGAYKTPINITARVIGRQVPSPKSNIGTFMAWHLEQTQTNLDKFEMTPELYDQLRIFRPRKGQTALDRCRQIAADLAQNVTKIYGRPELHIAYDLVWHSVLNYTFMGQQMGKGWLELLVVGDTRTGKSEAAQGLARHYNAGVVKSCEGMSFAGLVGGAQQMAGKHWMVTWGTIPLNDRRLVVLDEVSGLKDKDVIENMSSIRSSGKAQLTKIASDEASARTRLIWISNPPDGRALREINAGGMEVVTQLVTNPEDIARFDFAMAAASKDVDSNLINATRHEVVEHRFTSDLCSALVMWAWSRRVDQVHWMPGVEQAVVAAAKELGRRYVPDPPLVQVENVRMKLARLAVALAARTFSSSKSGEVLIVTEDHVKSAVYFMDMVYGMEAFGYSRHSRRAIAAQAQAEQFLQEVEEYLDQNSTDVKHTLLSVGGNYFKTRDFEEIGAMGRLEAQIAVRHLLEWKMIRRLSKGMMRMEPALIELLRRYEDQEEHGA